MFRYDPNGNLLQRSVGSAPEDFVFVYDALSRVVGVTYSFGDGVPRPLAAYVYDALGRRIAKTVNPGDPNAEVNVRFVYDRGALIETRDGGGNLQFDFVIREGHAEGKALDLFQVSSIETLDYRAPGQPKRFFFHADESGAVRALTDATGMVAERYNYADYGRPKFLDAAGNPALGPDGTSPATSSVVGNALVGTAYYEGPSSFTGGVDIKRFRTWDPDKIFPGGRWS